MIRAWLGGLCLAGLLGPVTAATPMREEFDPAASAASFEVGLRLSSGPVQGQFRHVEGELESVARQWRVQVRVDARAFQLDGPAWMQRSTASRSFLDVLRHPEISFTSEPFRRELLRTGGDLAGQLTLRGRSRPVSFVLLPSPCRKPGHACDIRVRGEVSRRSFGMTSQRLWVRDEVGFDFRVRLRETEEP